MEFIILIVILAAIFIIIMRRLPEVGKEFRDAAGFLGVPNKEEQRLNKFEASESGIVRRKKSSRKEAGPSRKVSDEGKATIEDVISKVDDLLDKKELKEAESMLIGLLEIDATNPKIYSKLGVVYLEQENFGDAKECFKTALKYDKYNDLFFNNLGLALFNQGRYVEAIEAYQKSIQLNSLVPHRYINLGLAYASLRRYDKALDAYKKALVLDKNNRNYEKLIKEAEDKLAETRD